MTPLDDCREYDFRAGIWVGVCLTCTIEFVIFGVYLLVR